MYSRCVVCILALAFVAGCSPETSSVTDGITDQQVKDYEALVELEAKRGAEAERMGSGE